MSSYMRLRKFDLRRQNIHQLRVDGDAMTRELEEVLGDISEESDQKFYRPTRSSTDLRPQLKSADAPDNERPTNKVVFQDEVFSSECGSDYVDPNPTSARSSLNSIDFKYLHHSGCCNQ
ncbi:unnamed protein product [Mortierella alpina]